MNNIKTIASIAVFSAMVACGGGGGASAPEGSVVEALIQADSKPGLATECGDWVSNGDGTDSRSCVDYLNGEKHKKYTETRETPPEYTCEPGGAFQIFYGDKEVDLKASGIQGYACPAGVVTWWQFKDGYSQDTIVFIVPLEVDEANRVNIETQFGTIIGRPTPLEYTWQEVADEPRYSEVDYYFAFDTQSHTDGIHHAAAYYERDVEINISKLESEQSVGFYVGADGKERPIISLHNNVNLATALNHEELTVVSNSSVTHAHADAVKVPMEGNLNGTRKLTEDSLVVADYLSTANQLNVFSLRNHNRPSNLPMDDPKALNVLTETVLHTGIGLDRLFMTGYLMDGRAYGKVDATGIVMEHTIFVDVTEFVHGGSTSHSAAVAGVILARVASDNGITDAAELKQYVIDNAPRRWVELEQGTGRYNQVEIMDITYLI